MDGGCPGRAHSHLQKSRAGKLGRSTGRAAGKCCISVCRRSSVKMRRRWGTNMVFFLSIWFVPLLTNGWCDSTGHWDPRELYAGALN